jgi:predicted 3-demethylubiquinone-9 3-methyltransferase (glyoxalase superfamily)
MPAITPNFLFNTEALEAATFYVSLFPNSAITSVSHYGDGAPLPAGTVLHVAFTLDGVAFEAINAGQDTPLTDGVSFRIVCHGQAEVDHYWDALVAGGEAGRCGWLRDQFGVAWQVSPVEMGDYLGHPDPVLAQKAMQAMLTMSKLDVGLFEAAIRA